MRTTSPTTSFSVESRGDVEAQTTHAKLTTVQYTTLLFITRRNESRVMNFGLTRSSLINYVLSICWFGQELFSQSYVSFSLYL